MGFLPWIRQNMQGGYQCTSETCLSYHINTLLYTEFKSGKFTVQKIGHVVSAMPVDQAHEQEEEMVKGDARAIGLTENPSALLRWMAAGPEIARLVGEFEHTIKHFEYLTTAHHEQLAANQERFKTNVSSLIESINEMGNPFEEESGKLLTLGTKYITDPSAHTTVRDVKRLGKAQYTKFVKERLINRSKPLRDSIPQNKFPLFKERPSKTAMKDNIKLKSVKTDCQLFSKLYIGCRNCDGNLP